MDGLVALTKDGVTSLKMYIKIHVSVQTRVTGNSNTLLKVAKSL